MSIFIIGRDGDMCQEDIFHVKIDLGSIIGVIHFLAVAGDALEFPDYYGCNWDAFEECILDMRWIRNRCIQIDFMDAGKIFDVCDASDCKNLFGIVSEAVVSGQCHGKQMRIFLHTEDKDHITVRRMLEECGVLYEMRLPEST